MRLWHLQLACRRTLPLLAGRPSNTNNDNDKDSVMWQRAKKAVEEAAEEEEQEEVVDTTGMTALQAWAAKQRVARRAAARKSAAPARRPRKVGSPCFIHYRASHTGHTGK